MGHVFVANGITEEAKKQAVFLSVIGPSTYKLLSSLLIPHKPGDKEYNTLVDKLSEHFTPAPSEIVEFHTRFRKPGESATVFISELHSIVKSCNFRDMLESMLQDHIVSRINDNIICRLLAEKALPFKTVLELTQEIKSTAKNVRELNVSTRELSVNQIGDNADNRSPPTYYRCGEAGHNASSCKYKETVCNKCGI